jgi:hypothetical protein
MKPSARNKPTLLIAFLVALLALTSLACSIGGLTLGRNSATIDITLSDDQVDRMFARATLNDEARDDVIFRHITGIDILDGYIRVYGIAEMADGSEVEGSYDVSIDAKNDVLVVQIIDVDIEGVTLDDPRIVDANQELTKELSEIVTESNGEVRFKEASVEDGELKMKVLVKFATPQP